MLCEDRCWRGTVKSCCLSGEQTLRSATVSIRYNKSLNFNPKRVACSDKKHLNLRVCGKSTHSPIKDDLVHIFTRVGGTYIFVSQGICVTVLGVFYIFNLSPQKYKPAFQYRNSKQAHHRRHIQVTACMSWIFMQCILSKLISFKK